MFKIFNQYKADYRCEYEYKVLQGILNHRKNQTILNLKNKIRITNEYNLLSVIDKEVFVLQYSFKFGCLKPLAFYAVHLDPQNEPENELELTIL